MPQKHRLQHLYLSSELVSKDDFQNEDNLTFHQG